MRNNLISTAAGLLRTVSTEREDYPTVPLYYLREIAAQNEKCRLAAIEMREAADHIAELETELRDNMFLVEGVKQLQAQNKILVTFARWVIHNSDGDWCGSIDGGDIQDQAVTAGLLIEEETVVPCGEVCMCAEVYDAGEVATCYRYADFMRLPESKDG